MIKLKQIGLETAPRNVGSRFAVRSSKLSAGSASANNSNSMVTTGNATTAVVNTSSVSYHSSSGLTPEELGYTDSEIEEAINTILASSLYHGDNRDR